jgi:hypothetical protein
LWVPPPRHAFSASKAQPSLLNNSLKSRTLADDRREDPQSVPSFVIERIHA